MANIAKVLYEAALEEAIARGDRPDIVKNLSLLAEIGEPLPPETILKLCAYLDPNRPAIKSGPKKPRTAENAYDIVEDYLYLCKNKRFAWDVIHCEEKIDLPIRDRFKNHRPWSPEQEKKRTPPTRDDIKGKVYKLYKISLRTFHNILAEHKMALAINDYFAFNEEGFNSDEDAKRLVCERHNVAMVKFEKALLR